MIYSKHHLETLHRERDKAFRKTLATLEEVKEQLQFKDLDLETYARKNPEVAVAGAVVAGVAASCLFLNRQTIMKVAKGAGIVVLGPLVGDLTEWLLQLFSMGTVAPEPEAAPTKG